MLKTRTQKERSDTTRAKLINAAITLICEHGYSHVRTQDIANYAGVTRGAIQHHFKSRAELFISILKHVESDWIQSFAAIPNQHCRLEERIDILLDNLWLVIQRPAYLAIIDIYMNTRSDTKLRSVVKKTVENSSKLYIKLWKDTFSPAVSDEVIEESRELCTAVLQGITLSEIIDIDNNNLVTSASRTFSNTKKLIHKLMLGE